jgi:hypothetical protein
MKKLYFFILSILLLNSCCKGDNENNGLIVASFLDSFQGYCYGYIPHTACIRKQSEFERIINQDSLRFCTNFKFPEIDFNKNSILINYKEDQAISTFSRHVSVDSLTKEITYLVSVNRLNCRCFDLCQSSNYNIILVPKVDSTFKVIYK